MWVFWVIKKSAAEEARGRERHKGLNGERKRTGEKRTAVQFFLDMTYLWLKLTTISFLRGVKTF